MTRRLWMPSRVHYCRGFHVNTIGPSARGPERTAVHPSPGQILMLGIETSCDETAAGVVLRSTEGHGRILSNVVRSQLDEHRPYGGVVPEIAARAHAECLDTIIERALKEAQTELSDLSGIAATVGPGLVNGLVVGAVTGKALAWAAGKPFLAINHLEAHALTVGLTEGLAPPYLMLLVSGGHTQTLLVKGVGCYERLGTTVDDALGEAFDKTAKLLGLDYPGGPEVERIAATGNPDRFELPRPMAGREEPHFSFAGLKTAIRHRAQALVPLTKTDVADLCASFQQAVTEAVSDRVARAMDLSELRIGPSAPKRLVVAGGVAANKALKAALERLAMERGYSLHVPSPQLCTDNGAMIAWAGAERLALGLSDSLDAPARPRWPLDADAPPAIGAGVKA